MSESVKHIFFDCLLAKEFWNLFGISMGSNVMISEVVTGSVQSLSKVANLFWSIISLEILWLI